MTFEEALKLCKAGASMRLPHWGPTTYVDKCEKPLAPTGYPYLVLRNNFGAVPWIPTFPEIFNDNWEVRL